MDWGTGGRGGSLLALTPNHAFFSVTKVSYMASVPIIMEEGREEEASSREIDWKALSSPNPGRNIKKHP